MCYTHVHADNTLCTDNVSELFSYKLKELLVSCLKMLVRGRIVIVIANENAHIKRRHVINDTVLALCRAGEAKVYVV